MPELAEVETCRRMMERTLVGQRIVDAEFAPDDIVFKGFTPEVLSAAMAGQKVVGVGRHGKLWWIECENVSLMGHLGMAGWLRSLGDPTIRLKEHGKKPLDDENGRPRFMKFILEAESGKRVALTDGRRLAKVWLTADPWNDPKRLAQGPDSWNEPADSHAIIKRLEGRTAPIKALLLDQSLFSGVGNWVADEVLFHAGINPKREGGSLRPKEAKALADALLMVLEKAIEVGADENLYPEDWLFHARWGGDKGHGTTRTGIEIRRDQVGGRTTAWAPKLQK